MTIIEPVDSHYHYIEYELNRLAGTLVNDLPTLGKATAALWWLGHRELNWALENRLTPNQATCGSALKTTDGFAGPNGEDISVVEGSAIFGQEAIQLKVPLFPPLETVPPSSTKSLPRGNVPVAYLALEPKVEVAPLHIYTAAAMIKAEQDTLRGTSFIFDWYDAEDLLIESVSGGRWSSKPDEWTQMWITGTAPENAASVQIKVRWEDVVSNESFSVDKFIFHNSADVQAWAYPGAGSVNLAAGLQAHLNMKAGIFNDAHFASVKDICNHLAGISEADEADALSLIATPNPLVAQ